MGCSVTVLGPRYNMQFDQRVRNRAGGTVRRRRRWAVTQMVRAREEHETAEDPAVQKRHAAGVAARNVRFRAIADIAAF